MLKYTCGYADAENNVRAWNGLSWAEFDMSGNLVDECKNPSYQLSGGDKDEAAKTIRHLHTAPYADVYLRFNDLPESGRSKNFATGEMEAGVSCYSLRWDFVSQCYKRTGGGLDGAMIAYAIQGAPVYLISGAECGVGSDGEPVLKGVKVLSNLKFDKDKDGYVLA